MGGLLEKLKGEAVVVLLLLELLLSASTKLFRLGRPGQFMSIIGSEMGTLAAELEAVEDGGEASDGLETVSNLAKLW